MSRAETAGETSAFLFVRSGTSRSEEPIRFLGKEVYVKVSGADTGGAYSLLEDVSPPRSGPPLHSHAFEEWFYVLVGEFLFEVDGRSLIAGPGDSVLIPGGTPHVFQNIGSGEGRVLTLVRPGGIEQYFAELEALEVQSAADLPRIAALAVQYGVTLLGPPIAVRQPK